VLQHTVTTGLVALVFWVWAAVVCATRHLDLGAVSFALVLLSSLLGFWAVRQDNPLIARWYRRLMPASCISVASNYVAGIVMVRRPWTLIAYFAVGAAWWTCASFIAKHFAASFVEEAEAKESANAAGEGAEMVGRIDSMSPSSFNAVAAAAES